MVQVIKAHGRAVDVVESAYGGNSGVNGSRAWLRRREVVEARRRPRLRRRNKLMSGCLENVHCFVHPGVLHEDVVGVEG